MPPTPTPTPTPTLGGYTFGDFGGCNCKTPCTPCNLPATNQTMTASYSGGSVTLTWNAGSGQWLGAVVIGGNLGAIGVNCIGGAGMVVLLHIQIGLSDYICSNTVGNGGITSYTCDPLSITADPSLAVGSCALFPPIVTAFGIVTVTQP